ncbi:hypothetical protein RD792_002164 [Penstemon davidsonii]|uniref:B box-type domain-containing protein n=1 Tax=Penstemon davidsonii TaxID=160366 RepID=A0ABR0DQB7_9LAMI|nr:hypothetical protein RD792_002164 [Penstemon davidsonii]
MKIQCDVCSKEEAYVFCTSDEAALCHNCDNRVHNANKLASKHPRFPLVHPQFKESPCCDICQKRRALLFCQEDRALLCLECDSPIHKANEHTKKHNRFLLSGVKINIPGAASSYKPAGTSSSGSQSQTEIKSVNSEIKVQPNSITNRSESTQQGSASTSSISEYLMETLPGWHVEDLFDSSSHYGFCKVCCSIYMLTYFDASIYLVSTNLYFIFNAMT